MDPFTKEQLDLVEAVEPQLGLEAKFFRNLYKDGDWSFIIKLHALIESCLSRELVAVVEPEGLKSFVRKLDLAGGRTSKLELLKSVAEISSNELKVIRGVAKIRNRLVHDVRHVSFDLVKCLNQLTRREQDEFVTGACAVFFNEEHPPKEERAATRADILAQPKAYLWLCGLHVAAMSILRCDVVTADAETRDLQRKTLEAEAASLRRLIEVSRSTPPSGLAQAAYHNALKDYAGDQELGRADKSIAVAEQKTAPHHRRHAV